MLVDKTDPEDVKAVIRKRFGSVRQFVAAKNLPQTGVSDLFRGRTSQRVRDAVERVLVENAQSITLDDSEATEPAHRLNAGGR